jgi:signal transduction histidine kinase
MTIKKRLFISNILMIVLPIIIVIVTNIVFTIIANIFLDGEILKSFRPNNPPLEMIAGLESSLNWFWLIALSTLVGTILIIILANVFLTKFVFSKIEKPLIILSESARQIGDGNLNYRIDYGIEDEFKPICESFNGMAEHLSAMVNAQQKDEANRRELIAGISHDLRTPLTSIKAYIEGIEKGVAATPEIQQRYFSTIKSKTNDLEYIIDQLFLFSKLDIGDFPFRFEKINIETELNCFMKTHEKEYLEKGLAVTLENSVEDVSVEVDTVQFRNVIQNILGNCVKYNTNEKAEAKIICKKDGENVLIRIADNGQGVSKEMLANIFEVFFREDSSRNNPSKGSGLGLAISKKIVERSNGSIKAENVSGGGLAITITLPIIK